MAVEGEFPKFDGDILYASEANGFYNSTPQGYYIPLGNSDDSSPGTTYEDVDYIDLTFDATNIQGDVFLVADATQPDSVKIGNIRLYNSTDAQEVTGSEITVGTNVNNITRFTSSSFTLPSASKVYKVQFKDETGASLIIKSAYLKIVRST